MQLLPRRCADTSGRVRGGTHRGGALQLGGVHQLVTHGELCKPSAGQQRQHEPGVGKGQQREHRTWYERVDLRRPGAVSAADCLASLAGQQGAHLLHIASVPLQEGLLGSLACKQDAALHLAHRLAPCPAQLEDSGQPTELLTQPQGASAAGKGEQGRALGLAASSCPIRTARVSRSSLLHTPIQVVSRQHVQHTAQGCPHAPHLAGRSLTRCGEWSASPSCQPCSGPALAHTALPCIPRSQLQLHACMAAQAAPAEHASGGNAHLVADILEAQAHAILKGREQSWVKQLRATRVCILWQLCVRASVSSHLQRHAALADHQACQAASQPAAAFQSCRAPHSAGRDNLCQLSLSRGSLSPSQQRTGAACLCFVCALSRILGHSTRSCALWRGNAGTRWTEPCAATPPWVRSARNLAVLHVCHLSVSTLARLCTKLCPVILMPRGLFA